MVVEHSAQRSGRACRNTDFRSPQLDCEQNALSHGVPRRRGSNNRRDYVGGPRREFSLEDDKFVPIEKNLSRTTFDIRRAPSRRQVQTSQIVKQRRLHKMTHVERELTRPSDPIGTSSASAFSVSYETVSCFPRGPSAEETSGGNVGQ